VPGNNQHVTASRVLKSLSQVSLHLYYPLTCGLTVEPNVSGYTWNSTGGMWHISFNKNRFCGQKCKDEHHTGTKNTELNDSYIRQSNKSDCWGSRRIWLWSICGLTTESSRFRCHLGCYWRCRCYGMSRKTADWKVSLKQRDHLCL
jgi:hypothetical protein